MVASKRVMNAKSERHYKNKLGKKPASVWQSFKKSLSGNPLLIAFMFFLLVGSGVFVFIMSLSQEKYTRMV